MTQARASARAAKRRTTFRRTTKPRDPRNRLIALLAVFVIIGAGFVALLVDLQTVRADRYRSLGEDQRTRTRQIAGYRGGVLDRNGFVLAASTPSHQIVADPTLVADPAGTAILLGPILGIDSATLTEQLTPDSETDRFSLLARSVDDEAVTRIQGLETGDDDALVGIFVLPEENRVYPAGELANAIVGRVDPDEQGITGVELQYNEVMTGIPGTEQFERGRFGSISVGDWKVDPATAGYDITLTIDHRIQYVAEQTLIDHCDATGAAGATAVVGDPHTGEVLAMAAVRRDDETGDCAVAGYNAALIDTFEPGSVMKPIVVAAATEELGYTADTLVEVPNRIVVGGKGFADHPSHPIAPYPISQIIANSMNVGTILVAQRLSADTVYDYMRAFGVGHPTGLDFAGESNGALRHPDEWWGSDYGSIPIGQGLTVNATQLLLVYNVFASGGMFVQPTLVRSMEAADGNIHSAALPDQRRIVSEDTAAEVTRSLRAVVEVGTGTNAGVPGYAVAGKTGTAWKVFDDGSGTLGYGSDRNRRYVVSFVGYLPADDPQLTMAVVVDEPQSDWTASAVAAPVFAEIAEYATRLLEIPPGSPAGMAVTPEGRVRSLPAEVDVAGPSVADTAVALDEGDR
ncbi:MAG: peptidoglycan D,D-transpeptidase FtsI family protein [Acidimicrobiales bacterium]